MIKRYTLLHTPKNPTLYKDGNPHLSRNVGLYRDDGLAITNKPPRAVENIKKRNVQNI